MAAKFPTLYQIETRVQTACRTSLPGSEAHQLLAPRPRRGWQPGEVPSDAKTAAVLALFYPLNQTPHLLLTVRARQLPTHAGQVSLPGGVIEGSEEITDAALREAFEEVGVEPAEVRIVGALSPLYIPATAFALHPVVGISDTSPELSPAAAEVERAIEVPLRELADPENLRLGTRQRQGHAYDVPYFEVRNERVWGATSMILAELLTVLGLGPRNPW